MAQKKPKLNKTTLKRLRKNKQLRRWLPLLTLAAGLGLGLAVAWLQPATLHLRTLVWAADDSVTVPADLANFLRKQRDCRTYRGSNGPEGVTLWSVYKTSGGKFAKMAYGCSTNLTSYIMAVKEAGKWQLLQPTEYFAPRTSSSGAVNSYLPKCAMVDKYRIDRGMEPFCLEDTGQPRENPIE